MGELKHNLKKVVRGTIPDELIDRPEQGFGVPAYEWLLERLGGKTRQEFSDFCDKTDFLDKGEVLKYVDNNRGGQAWYLLDFALWWQEYIG